MAITSAKPPTEAEMRQFLLGEGLVLPPVSFRMINQEVDIPADLDLSSAQKRRQADGVLEACWQGRSERFVVEYKAQSTPKAIDAAADQAVRYGKALDLPPLIVVPFLSEERLKSLEAQKVSAVDLSGNGVLVGQGFSIWRSGAPNRFKETQSIKNVFRGTSSLYARSFLLRREFASLAELREFALSRFDLGSMEPSGTSRLVKSTASKVVQALEEEQIVFRQGDALRLVNPKRLLEQLQKNYARPPGPRLEGKTSLSPAQAWQRLSSAGLSGRAVTTGLGSAGYYGALSGIDGLNLYVTDLGEAAALLEVQETRVFPNVWLTEDKSDSVYFDARPQQSARWASPIQCWLELATGGPREQDASQSLEVRLTESGAEDMQ